MLFRVKIIALIICMFLIWELTGSKAQPVRPSLSWLALGDSYTIGESVAPGDRYAQQTVALLRAGHLPWADPEILATTGWTTGNLLQALDARKGKTVDLVTLLIGVNNQYQGRSQAEFRTELTELAERSVALAGGRPSHVIVLSIPDYSVSPFAAKLNRERIASQIDSFNAINQDIAAQYKLHYLDITAESRRAIADSSLFAADGLHFSGKEYGIWARLLEPVIREISQESKSPLSDN